MATLQYCEEGLSFARLLQTELQRVYLAVSTCEFCCELATLCVYVCAFQAWRDI
jgi:hypothetical protein